MKLLIACLAALLAACTAPSAPATRLCPPLPTLPAGATPAQRQLHHETVITFYAECARGRP